jgi:Tfp pilus assembly protein PilO
MKNNDYKKQLISKLSFWRKQRDQLDSWLDKRTEIDATYLKKHQERNVAASNIEQLKQQIKEIGRPSKLGIQPVSLPLNY